MRVLITGSRGALGTALTERMAGEQVFACNLPECDITEADKVNEAILPARPEVVLHCAAMTDVDGCARDPDLAHRVNALGTRNVAAACAEAGAAMLYVSTNEVFDGAAARPYGELDPTGPINAYGRSKLAGEEFVTHWLKRFYIVRTSWLYAPGGQNFIHKILRLAREGRPLHIVADEVASPTSVGDLADGILALVTTGHYGIYHLTNEGYCSRWEWACKALELAGLGNVPITPITRADYPRPSEPPAFTPLANNAAAALGIRLRPWERAVEEFLKA